MKAVSRRPILLSVAAAFVAAILVIVADLVLVAYWQPAWLVECVPETVPPLAAVNAAKPDLQASVSETFVSGSVCTDRYTVPVAAAVGLLAAAATYRGRRRR